MKIEVVPHPAIWDAKEEIWEIFKQVNRIFILACGKCYRRFEEENEEEYTHPLEILGKDHKIFVGHTRIDFLCGNFCLRRGF